MGYLNQLRVSTDEQARVVEGSFVSHRQASIAKRAKGNAATIPVFEQKAQTY